MKKVDVKVANRNRDYEVIIENRVLSHVKEYVDLNRKIMIVTDSGVPERFERILGSQCKECVVYRFQNGEKNKNQETLFHILDELLKWNFTRKDLLIALGGGVVGDMAGLAASLFMRGIEFVNIPTTVLSQVDSSVGGKTAIDFHGVKNVLGAFYFPSKVIIDPETILSLSERQRNNGLVEAIKMAATFDAELFEKIAGSSDIEADLPYIIERSVELKQTIVQEDPFESGVRKVLNFGHTLGHVYESHAKGALLHGEAVGIGMLAFSSLEVKKRIRAVLLKYNLPVSYSITKEEAKPILLHDKKAGASTVKVVVVNQIGKYELIEEDIERVLDRLESL